MWSRGDVVALREVWHGRVWKARPWIVVEDTPELLALWIPRGAHTILPTNDLPTGAWEHRPSSFRTNALRLTRPGPPHSILLFFDDDGVFERWYVNLEGPLTRSPVGFDLDDLFLDLLVEPDGSHRWLDEDELDAALAAGLLTEDDAAAARAEGERVLSAWPFPTGREDFRPDPRWEPPRLPAGWNVVD
jgi:Protein of unknown function (DUF402)